MSSHSNAFFLCIEKQYGFWQAKHHDLKHLWINESGIHVRILFYYTKNEDEGYLFVQINYLVSFFRGFLMHLLIKCDFHCASEDRVMSSWQKGHLDWFSAVTMATWNALDFVLNKATRKKTHLYMSFSMCASSTAPQEQIAGIVCIVWPNASFHNRFSSDLSVWILPKSMYRMSITALCHDVYIYLLTIWHMGQLVSTGHWL